MSRATFRFLAVGVAVALLLAFGVSQKANSNPDGLEKVASTHALDAGEKPHAMRDAPMAGYTMQGVDSPGLSTGMSGVVGVVITFGLAVGAGWVATRRRASRAVAREDTRVGA